MLVVTVLAQAAAAAAPVPQAVPQQGVISYPPSFFAAFQPANVAEMVERIPGFILDSGASVRGYEGAAGNVLIDGQRPATKTDELEQILRRMPASRVERIDLIRGGAPGIDMQGKTVIANVIRKSGGGVSGTVATAYGRTWDGRDFPALRLEATGSLGDRKWELGFLGGKGIDDGYGDGRVTRIPPGGVARIGRIRAEGDELNAQVTGAVESPLLGGRIRLNGRAFQDKYKADDASLFDAPTPTVEQEDDVIFINQTEIGANYTRDLGRKLKMELVGLRSDRTKNTDANFTDGVASTFALRRDSSETIGRGVLKYQMSERLSLEGGAETAINKLHSRTRLTRDGAQVALPAANVQVEEKRSEGFVKATWRPASAWTVDGSLRYETSRISSDGDVVLSKQLHFVKPRLAITWAAGETTQVRLRLEREVGQLNFDDFVATARLNTGSGVVAGNPNLDPDQAWVAEAALEQRFWTKGSVVVTFRHFELKDVIDKGPVFAADGRVFDQPANIGDGTKDELKLELSIPFDRLGLSGATLRGDVTKRWSSVTDPTTREKREISALRPIEWNANFTQDLPRLHLSYGVDAFSAWRETNYRFNLVETTKLKTFVVPFLEYRPQPQWNIRFEIRNLTNRGLRRTVSVYPGPRDRGGVPDIEDRDYQPGRMYYVRIRRTFGG